MGKSIGLSNVRHNRYDRMNSTIYTIKAYCFTKTDKFVTVYVEIFSYNNAQKYIQFSLIHRGENIHFIAIEFDDTSSMREVMQYVYWYIRKYTNRHLYN